MLFKGVPEKAHFPISATLSGIAICSSFVSAKAFLPILSRFPGSVTFPRLLHPENSWSSICFRSAGRTASLKEVHSLKAPFPRAVTESGIFIALKAVHPLNAPIPTAVTESGIIIALKAVHSLNALFLIFFSVPGRLISFNDVHPANALSPIVCSPSPISTSRRLRKPENAPFDMLLTPSSKTIFCISVFLSFHGVSEEYSYISPVPEIIRVSSPSMCHFRCSPHE